MEDHASFGYWLRRQRKARDLTQAELGQRVGCSEATIRKIEADERRPSRQVAERLADVLALAAAERLAFLQAARAELAVDKLSAPLPPSHRGAVQAAQPALPIDTVTFLFTDIEGSTRLWEQHPQAMPEALAQHNALIRAAIEAQGGVVFRTVGDAFCAAFARATDALAAALNAQHALQRALWGASGPLLIRMALHTGVVARAGDDYQGLPLSRIARLVAAGHGGQVLLSRATYELVREQLPADVTLHDLGAHQLKDLTAPEQIFQLVAPDLPSDFPPLRTLSAYRTNLPAQPTVLLGRDAEVRTVADLLRRGDVRLLTLTGPGGVGKTRLALQVATELLDAFADGIWFVNLAPISDPNLVIPTIAQVLGVKEGGGQPLPDTLKAYLRTKQLLLLLDNFEQVVETASQVAELLAAAPQLKVLVSSRAVLHMYGEYEFIVPPLALPSAHQLPALSQLAQYPAVQLFVARAQAVKAGFALTEDNAPAVAAICQHLDGLPLAIELAVARTKLFTPQVLLTRLAHRLTVLTGGARDLPARQQTLRDAIAWSYQLLSAAEQTLFRRLAVFVGGCAVEAAEAVCNVQGDLPGDVLAGLAALVDQSLVRQEGGPDGEPRFGMLETIREYALEQLEGSGEAEMLQRQHGLFFLQVAEEAEPQLHNAQQRVWLTHLATDHANLRAALGWAIVGGHTEVALRLGGALWWFWYFRGHLSEGRSWIEGALARTGALEHTPSRAKALYGGGALALLQGDYPVGCSWLEEALALFQELRDKRGVAYALTFLGGVWFWQGDYAAARLRLEEALAIWREEGDRWGLALTLNGLGNTATGLGEYTIACTLYEESMALFRQIGDRWGLALPLSDLGYLAMMQGNYATARARLEEALAIWREVGDRWLSAQALNFLGDVAWCEGDYRVAHERLGESLVLREELGDKQGMAASLNSLGLLAQSQDDGRALAHYRASLALSRELGDKQTSTAALEGLAGVLSAQGDVVWAMRLCGAAAALREAIGTPVGPPAHRSAYKRMVAAMRTQLCGEAFAAAWAEGQAMTLEQAIAYALSEDDGGTALP